MADASGVRVRLAAGQRVRHGLADAVGIVGMDDRERVRAHEFFLGIAEQRMLGRGGVLDVPVEVEAQDHVARALDDRAVELLRLAE